MPTRTDYERFWPEVDRALARRPGAPEPRAFRPEKNYRDFFGPTHPEFPVRWSINFPREGMRVEANLALGRPEQTDRAEGWLADHVEDITQEYDGPEDVIAEARDTARGNRVCRVAVYRAGTVGQVDPSQSAEWFVDRLEHLQAAFGAAATGEPVWMPGETPTPVAQARQQLSGRGYQKPYVPKADRELRLQAAIAAADFALAQTEMHPTMRKRILVQATWEVTEVDGKLTPKFRSPAAMSYDGPKYHSVLRHDHVFTRAGLIAQLLKDPSTTEQVLRAAVACLVTQDEHTRLSAFDTMHEGWDRYLAAQVDVLDAGTGQHVIRDGAIVGELHH